MTDPLTFLTARFDEDEQVALAASPGPWRPDDETQEVLAADGITVADGFALSGHQLRATVEHIARHDPARVLREVEAKRRMLELHSPSKPGSDECAVCDYGADSCGCMGMNGGWPCATITLLALPYADHPDYQTEWQV